MKLQGARFKNTRAYELIFLTVLSEVVFCLFYNTFRWLFFFGSGGAQQPVG